MIEQYVERVHTEYAVLNIGQGVGALAIYTGEDLLGEEIEVSIKGNDSKRIHTAIHERRVNGHSIFAGLFLALPVGEYIIWVHPSSEVIISSGYVTEVNWSDREVFVPSARHRHAYGTLGETLGQTPRGEARDLLPPRYQNGQAVSAAPMGSASLRYTDDGQVAWNEIWTNFCDLALAGGPPHRASLLEPVPPDEITEAPEDYERVVAEIERGLRLVTGLPTVRSEKSGWVGLRCTNEEMALWILRAVVVENVCVRREGSVLYLPAGPAFQLEKEIKNVITVIAKTHHYWTEHCLA